MPNLPFVSSECYSKNLNGPYKMTKESINKTNIPKKLSVFTAITEQNLEYILNLTSTLEDPAVKYKNDDKSGRLAKLKSDIKTELAGYPPDEIILTITFMTALESVYSSANEIKGYIKELIKYPPVGFDLSEITIKISGIAKKAIDRFFTGNIDTDLEPAITENERLINAALRRLNKLNGKENREKGRIIYYAGITAMMKGIIRNFSCILYS